MEGLALMKMMNESHLRCIGAHTADAAAFAVLLCYSRLTYLWVRLHSKALHNCKCGQSPLADFSKRSLRRFSGRRPQSCLKARQGRITQKVTKIRLEKRMRPYAPKVDTAYKYNP